MAGKIPKVKLNNGRELQFFGLGTMAAKEGNCVEATKHAIDVGYRHFDTAYLYENEAPVGQAIREKIAEGVITREDVFVTTKLWCTYHEEAMVLKACQMSLKNLGLDYIDLYLIHFPVGFPYRSDTDHWPKDGGVSAWNDVDYLETWRGMEQCVKNGWVRSIGISNFNSEQIDRLLGAATIKPVVNQVECSPSINQKKLTAFCKARDIVVTAYSPLGQPNVEKKTPDYMFSDKVKAIGDKYGKSNAQVVLRFLVSSKDI
jgi:aldehyde reductase